MTGSRAIRLLLVVVVCLIASTETDRLIADTLTSSGQSYRLGVATGPLAFLNTQPWEAWNPDLDLKCLIAAWVLIGVPLWLAVRVLTLHAVVGAPAAALAIRIAFVLQIVEWMLLGAFALGAPGTALTIPLALVSSLKWATLAVAVIAVVRNQFVRGLVATAVRDAVLAVWAQRLSFVVVLALGVLALVPSNGVLEQLPDVARGWVDDLPGIGHFALSAFATGVLGFVLFVLGRKRSERHFLTFVTGTIPTAEPRMLWWLFGPGVAIAAGVLLYLTGHVELIDDIVLTRFLGVLFGILALTLLVRRLYPNNRLVGAGPSPVPPLVDPPGVNLWLPTPPPIDVPRAHRIARAGDILAGLMIVIAGLSLVRSFTAPALITALKVMEIVRDPSSSTTQKLADVPYLTAYIGLCIAGVTIALLALPAARRVVSALDAYLAAAPGAPPALAGVLLPANYAPGSVLWRWFAIGGSLASVVFLLFLVLVPRSLAAALGTAATTTLAFTAWSLIIGIGVIEMQSTRPLHLFRLLHLRSNPVLTLLVAVPLVLSAFGGSPDLHALQETPHENPTEARLSLSEAFTTWYTASSACDRDLDGEAGVSGRPLVIAAAEGGGIRAATWTVDVFSELSVAGDCAQNAVLLSSGASGGSVGLTMFQPGGDPTENVEALGDGDALASVVAGTFVSDIVAGTSGLRIPSPRTVESGGASTWEWQDRAALMQSEWRTKASGLYRDFDFAPQSPTGWRVLNSTTINPNCKVLVSQLDLGSAIDPSSQEIEADPGAPATVLPGTDPAPTAKQPDCRSGSAELPGAIDLVETYADCPLNLDWGTAAMLSARFPFVTPAGRVSRESAGGVGDARQCSHLPDMQLLDGGYYDNTGLGTISDLAPELASLIAIHNSTAVAQGQSIVVPVVVYVRNSAGADVAAPAPRITQEFLVPAVGFSTKDLQLEPGTWLQRIAKTFAAVCPRDVITDPNADADELLPNDPAAANAQCVRAVESIRDSLGYGVAVVAPNTSASLEAPLGWQLSELSRRILCEKIQDQLDGRPVVKSAYGQLPELLHVLEPEKAEYGEHSSAVTASCAG